jgi:serpin B
MLIVAVSIPPWWEGDLGQVPRLESEILSLKPWRRRERAVFIFSGSLTTVDALMKPHAFLLLLSLLLVPAARVPAAADDQQALTAGNNQFAVQLYQALSSEDGNLFLSPFSISSALAMTYAGARDGTAAEMSKTLQFKLDPPRLHPAFDALNRRLNDTSKPRGYQLSVANSLWAQQGFQFLPEFTDLNKKYYGAGFREVDFAGATEKARQTINGWVEEKTNNKIKELLKKGILNSLTRMVLVNAIYFKGTWAQQFDKAGTTEAPFHLDEKKEVKVQMMSRKDQFRTLEEENLQVLELPYNGKELSMVLLLPKEIGGLRALEKSLTSEKIAGWMAKLTKKEIHVYLPRFTVTSGFRLDETLKKLGMPSAFNVAEADFSGMTGKKDLYITAVVHKAFVDVNEEGTEAAAATAVVMGLKSVAMQPLEFRADHPFLFLIRENASGAILFIGRLSNPGQ